MTVATNMLAKYLAAEEAILEGKQISFNGRTLGMEDLDKIIAGRKEWEQRVSQEAVKVSGKPTIGGMSFSVARFGGE